MEEKTTAFVFASSEVQAILADNETNLIELLEREGCEVERGAGQNPSEFSSSGNTKEVVTTILASAALIAVLTPAVIKVIQALTYKSVVVYETVLIPVEDTSGNIVRSSSGEPLLQWVRRSKLLETKTENIQQETTIKALGFEIEVKNSNG
ncbi:MAG: hypothetical protein AAGN15_24160 [Cyanobacteria bacterium J06581_3]